VLDPLRVEVPAGVAALESPQAVASQNVQATTSASTAASGAIDTTRDPALAGVSVLTH
jgi:hypothetical protein